MKNSIWMVMLVAMVLGVLSSPVMAAALTDNRDTPEYLGKMTGPVQGSNTIFAGSIVAVDSNGLAVAASDAPGLKVIGRALVKSVNVLSDYVATKRIRVQRGIFRWGNGGSFTAANIGDLAYLLDDQTVTTAALATNDIIAGLIMDVDSDGVWVDTFSIGGQGAASVAALNVSGNAAVGGTLAATGNTSLGGTLAVTGASTLGGNTAISGTLAATGTTTLTNMVINGVSVSLGNLPTATNGLAAGRLWSDSGALKLMQ